MKSAQINRTLLMNTGDFISSKIALGGMNGKRAADFSAEKSLPCRFCGRSFQNSSKIWRGWLWRGGLLPCPQGWQILLTAEKSARINRTLLMNLHTLLLR